MVVYAAMPSDGSRVLAERFFFCPFFFYRDTVSGIGPAENLDVL